MNSPARNPASPPPDTSAALLSALVDGDPSALHAACALWRDDAGARATWHAYHLIGDVLRSDDLAAPAARDAAFLSALRTRLADEPIAFAPARAPRRRHRWIAPTAVAAGFVAVAGVLVVTRVAAPPAGSVQAVAADPAQRVAVVERDAAPRAVSLETTRVIRDPRLDAYLRLHRQALGGVPAAVPGGVPRNVETLAPIIPVTAAQTR